MVTTPEHPDSPSPPMQQASSALSHLFKSGLFPSSSPEASDLHQESIQRLAALLASQHNNQSPNNSMKVPPISLPGSLPLPFPPDLLWRYPNPFLPPPSPLENQLKTHLPGGLGHDPRIWSRDDVAIFLRFCEREFDLEKIDMDKFQMNGKALCLLNKLDLSERCSGAGDVIHNILQSLIREVSSFHPPSSPLITPTSPAFPQNAWPLLGAGAAAAAVAAAVKSSAEATATTSSVAANHLSHIISQANSVTLSPAPSIESQNGTSPKHSEITSIHQLYPIPNSTTTRPLHVPPPLGVRAGSASSHEESDEEIAQRSPSSSSGTPRTPTLLSGAPRSPRDSTPTSSSPGGKGESDSTPELNTNGRLLWDFLQQLLNDKAQRYSQYIAWKDKESGVFKIVDPAGLAKLWGIQKNHLSMNYDKMSRALRYYYRVNILRKVQGERHCYQFLRQPAELKSIKNISLLRQQIEQRSAAEKLAQQLHQSEEPTDLSMDAKEKATMRVRMMERSRNLFNDDKDAERDREEHEPRSGFDFRHLIPQVSIKTENY